MRRAACREGQWVAIQVGSGVLPIQVQHPMQLAQRALTLNLIAGGREAIASNPEILKFTR